MLHVLRHYLPFRKAVLVASELAILTVVVGVLGSAHLWWNVDELTLHRIAVEGLSPADARWRCLVSALMVSVLAQVAIGFNELYDFRLSSSRFERASRFLGSAGSAVLLVCASIALVQVWGVERILDFPGLPFTQRLVVMAFALMLGFVLLYLWRAFFHGALHRLGIEERVLVLGSGPVARRLASELRARDGAGYVVAGLVRPPGTDRETSREDRRRWRRQEDRPDPPASPPPVEGTVARRSEPRVATLRLEAPASQAEAEADVDPPLVLADDEPLHELARRLDVDEIVVALEDRRGVLPTRELLQCRLNGLIVEEAESLYERVSGKIAVEAMRPSYLIFNPGFVQHPLSRAAKRLLDLVLALVVLALTWPVMIAAAIAIRLDSPGPVLFRQTRTGRHGEPFTLLKFRSMRTDAEKHTGPVWATENDPRITRVGRFLRRTRVDELPQLFNVLGGSMSMVGPRPERPNFVAELAEHIPYYEQRHIVKPGLTGWAQTNYPYGNTLEDASQKLQYDLFYIKFQSLLFDLSILFNTIKTVVLRKGT